MQSQSDYIQTNDVPAFLAAHGKDNIMRLEFQGTEPTRAYQGDAGYDLRANVGGVTWLAAGERKTIPLGTRLGIPRGYAGMIVPRSGLAHRHGITVVNSPGIVDPGFSGEVMAVLLNTSDTPFRIEPGDRVAQLVLVKVEHPVMVPRDDLGFSDRNTSGFGSSGVK